MRRSLCVVSIVACLLSFLLCAPTSVLCSYRISPSPSTSSHLLRDVSTVSTFNVTQYLGRFYQVYSNFVISSLIEKDAVCLTADYALLPSHNGTGLELWEMDMNEYRGSDKRNNATGYMYVPDSTHPGAFMIKQNVSPVATPYWILAVGPVVNDQYEWSIVSDNWLLELYVLTRDVKRFDSLYDQQVQQLLSQFGFNWPWNKPIRNDQTNCNYLPPQIKTTNQQTKQNPQIIIN